VAKLRDDSDDVHIAGWRARKICYAHSRPQIIVASRVVPDEIADGCDAQALQSLEYRLRSVTELRDWRGESRTFGGLWS
jgi:hypothetical protein